jgi:hypothetical protein
MKGYKKMDKETFETGCGCIAALVLIPVIAFVGYVLLHIIIWLIPFLLVCAIIIFILYIFCRGLASFCK